MHRWNTSKTPKTPLAQKRVERVSYSLLSDMGRFAIPSIPVPLRIVSRPVCNEKPAAKQITFNRVRISMNTRCPEGSAGERSWKSHQTYTNIHKAHKG